FRRSARPVETGRHDADDPIQIRIETYAFVQNMRVLPKRPLPQAVADDDFLQKSRRMILGMEGAAQLWLYAEERKIIRRDKKNADVRWLRSAGEIVFVEPRRRDIFKNSRVLQILPFGLRHSYIPCPGPGEVSHDAHKLLRLRVRQCV